MRTNGNYKSLHYDILIEIGKPRRSIFRLKFDLVYTLFPLPRNYSPYINHIVHNLSISGENAPFCI
jgi:hypothetical protein